MKSLKVILLASMAFASFSQVVDAKATQKVTVKSIAEFKDVSVKYWAKDSIIWAKKNQIVSGFPNGTFQPEKKVTEEEFLVMLIRSYQSLSVTPGEGWSVPYSTFAKEHGWKITGKSTAIVTRGEVASIMTSAAGGDSQSEVTSIQYLLDVGISKGKTNATYAGYKPKESLTRAEAVQFVRMFKSKVESLKNGDRSPTDPRHKEIAAIMTEVATGLDLTTGYTGYLGNYETLYVEKPLAYGTEIFATVMVPKDWMEVLIQNAKYDQLDSTRKSLAFGILKKYHPDITEEQFTTDLNNLASGEVTYDANGLKIALVSPVENLLAIRIYK